MFPLRRRVHSGILVSLLVIGSCRDENVGNIDAGFSVDEAQLDFGRVQELLSKTQNVTLVATTRASVTVNVETTGPFVTESRVEIPGGGSLLLPITFTASNTSASGILTLRANEEEVTVALRGEGVRPLNCLSPAPCIQSRYEFETHRCVETVLPNESPCTPESLCQENGQCFSGQCVGEERQCDDKNVCTSDGCSEAIGCVNSPVACPASTNPCKVPVCDATLGCGLVNALDGTACGAIDCITSQVCVLGACQAVPTADGTLCAPRTPCQAEGLCQNKVCVRPDAGILQPQQVIPLDETLVSPPRLLAHQGAIYFQTCDLDGGCQLHSFTATGLERFVSPLDGGPSQHILNVSEKGLTARSASALTSYSTATGEWQWDVPLVCEDDAVTLLSTGELSVLTPSDGGESLFGVSTDGGVQLRIHLEEDGPSTLLSTASGDVFVRKPSGRIWRVVNDAGVAVSEEWAQTSSEFPLTGNSDVLWVAENEWAFLDGGALISSVDDAGFSRRPNSVGLLSRQVAYSFYEGCEVPQMSCPQKPLWLRAFSTTTGNLLWQTEVLEESEDGAVLEASVMTPEAVYVVSQMTGDAGTQSWAQGFSEGQRLFLCPFPTGHVPVAAVFEGSSLHVVSDVDGGQVLESFELQNVSAASSAWPSSRGVSGSRRIR